MAGTGLTTTAPGPSLLSWNPTLYQILTITNNFRHTKAFPLSHICVIQFTTGSERGEWSGEWGGRVGVGVGVGWGVGEVEGEACLPDDCFQVRPALFVPHKPG